jgi:hypothetical protein
VVNTFGWQRFEVVQLDVEGGGREEARKPKRAKLEQNNHTQMLHDGSEIGLFFSLFYA